MPGRAGDAAPRRYRPAVGAVLAEQHDKWTEGRRYLGLDLLSRCRLRPATEATADSKEVTIPALSA